MPESDRSTRTTLYLKREDLLHGGAHKPTKGAGLSGQTDGQTEIIAETGAASTASPQRWPAPCSA